MGERTSNEMENLSLQTKSRFPRDLLQRFTLGTIDAGRPTRSDPDEDPGFVSGEELELNLGLSLGGRFGVDKSNSKLVRSSSIATILPEVKDDDVLGSGKSNTGPGRDYSGLTRTSSLPVETEDEWRKRKELQSLRRLAAKRRRSEKQRNLTKGERDEYVSAMGRVGSSPGPQFRPEKWPPTDSYSGGGTTAGGSASKGSSGSGGETRSLQEHSSCSNSNPSLGSSSGFEQERSSPGKREEGKETGSGSMEEMPCVFTQGDGPNGRVIEGILYKYGRGEQVKIMCVCHGSFLSPAEFVKHAGGTDFLNPLKHIVVKPTSSFS